MENHLPAADLDVNGYGLIGSGEQSVASAMLTGYDELGRRVSETDASNRTKRYSHPKGPELIIDTSESIPRSEECPVPSRIQYPGALYHLMSRGDRREAIFLDDADRNEFLRTLGEASVKMSWVNTV